MPFQPYPEETGVLHVLKDQNFYDKKIELGEFTVVKTVINARIDLFFFKFFRSLESEVL